MYDQIQGDTAAGLYRVEQDGDCRKLWLLQEHRFQYVAACGRVRDELVTPSRHVGPTAYWNSVSEYCGQRKSVENVYILIHVLKQNIIT